MNVGGLRLAQGGFARQGDQRPRTLTMPDHLDLTTDGDREETAGLKRHVRARKASIDEVEQRLRLPSSA